MAGRIAMAAPHLDGSEDVGVWFDVAWHAYLTMAIELAAVDPDAIDEMWTSLLSESEDGQPTPEEWGTSERAQKGQAALMAMFGGSPDMGAAPGFGEEG